MPGIIEGERLDQFPHSPGQTLHATLPRILLLATLRWSRLDCHIGGTLLDQFQIPYNKETLQPFARAMTRPPFAAGISSLVFSRYRSDIRSVGRRY